MEKEIFIEWLTNVKKDAEDERDFLITADDEYYNYDNKIFILSLESVIDSIDHMLMDLIRG